MNSSRPLSTKSLALQERFVVEVAGKVAHLAFEIVALADDVPGEVFFAVPLSDVAVLEALESIVKLHIVIDCIGAVFVAHIRVLHNIGYTRHSLSKLNSALIGSIFRGYCRSHPPT